MTTWAGCVKDKPALLRSSQAIDNLMLQEGDANDGPVVYLDDPLRTHASDDAANKLKVGDADEDAGHGNEDQTELPKGFDAVISFVSVLCGGSCFSALVMKLTTQQRSRRTLTTVVVSGFSDAYSVSHAVPDAEHLHNRLYSITTPLSLHFFPPPYKPHCTLRAPCSLGHNGSATCEKKKNCFYFSGCNNTD